MSVAPSRVEVPAFNQVPAQLLVDALEYGGAMSSAVTIRSAWWSKGFAVRVWIERSTYGVRHQMFVVRSDLRDGCPRRRALQGEDPLPIVLRSEAP
jgi:hypothetical protein